jgi:formylmethanofuran dehydrogenase subunit C
MSGLRLSLRVPPPERLDLAILRPETFARLSARDIARLPVGTSRLGVRLGDCFDVELRDGSELVIEGGSSRLDNVAQGWTAGTVLVEGDVGQRLARGLAGASVTVRGNAGPFAATQASAGTVIIEGEAAERAGGALHGHMAGLDGATLVVKGRAGDRLGDRMRRGLIVADAAGDYAAARLIAGTIVAGTVGDYAGYSMRRGTLLVGSHGAMTPTFVDTGVHRMVMVRLLERMLRPISPQLADLAVGDQQRHAGDLATLGKGELLTPARPLAR